MRQLGPEAWLLGTKSAYGVGVSEYARLELPGVPIWAVDAQVRAALARIGEAPRQPGRLNRGLRRVGRALVHSFGGLGKGPRGTDQLIAGVAAAMGRGEASPDGVGGLAGAPALER